ncbi:MAG: YfcE family phosphodiesterase [Deltaproteobacteria bacterium]|nr:YfcE family phosphodiesterase [Deltaproteobacteria bacterium]
MRIGVVSDTHNHLPNVARLVALLNAAGVARVVHTGDITQAKTLEVLARLHAPLYGVFGNNDLGEREALAAAAARLGIALCDAPLELSWADRRLVVAHDPSDLALARDGDPRVALHGHTHRRTIERPALGGLVFNPGECAGHLRGRNAVGVVDLVTLEVELLTF